MDSSYLILSLPVGRVLTELLRSRPQMLFSVSHGHSPPVATLFWVVLLLFVVLEEAQPAYEITIAYVLELLEAVKHGRCMPLLKFQQIL